MPSFSEVVESGDRKASLIALRNLLAFQLENAAARDVAALSRQLRDVLEELSNNSSDESSPINDLAILREKRRATAREAEA